MQLCLSLSLSRSTQHKRHGSRASLIIHIRMVLSSWSLHSKTLNVGRRELQKLHWGFFKDDYSIWEETACSAQSLCGAAVKWISLRISSKISSLCFFSMADNLGRFPVIPLWESKNICWQNIIKYQWLQVHQKSYQKNKNTTMSATRTSLSQSVLKPAQQHLKPGLNYRSLWPIYP